LKLDENRRIGSRHDRHVSHRRRRPAQEVRRHHRLSVAGRAHAEELREAVHQMRDCDFVLIDTAGRSPKTR